MDNISTRILSPSKSEDAPRSSRQYKLRRSQSVVSSIGSNASGRLTSLINFDRNMASCVLSPASSKLSVLSDNTDIQVPRRRSWWRKLDENSREIMEVLNINKKIELNNDSEELDLEVPSQVQRNCILDLPESSESGSIASIVIPQRRLFTQKENQPPKKFKEIISSRELMNRQNKAEIHIDESANVHERGLFQNKTRSKPGIPSTLLKRTKLDDVRKLDVPERQIRKIFGNNEQVRQKNMFAQYIGSDTFDSSNVSINKSVGDNTEGARSQKNPVRNIFRHHTGTKRKNVFAQFVVSSGSLSIHETIVDKSKGTEETENKVRNIFGNHSKVKRNNIFTEFVGIESEDEIADDIQLRGIKYMRESSPTSCSSSEWIDSEMDDWTQLPSSTRMENQLQDAIETLQQKSSQIREAESSSSNNTVNKTKQSNKSGYSKNKSILSQYSVKESSVNQDTSAARRTRSKSRISLIQDRDDTLNNPENTNIASLENNSLSNSVSRNLYLTLINDSNTLKNTSKQSSVTTIQANNTKNQINLHEPSNKSLSKSKLKSNVTTLEKSKEDHCKITLEKDIEAIYENDEINLEEEKAEENIEDNTETVEEDHEIQNASSEEDIGDNNETVEKDNEVQNASSEEDIEKNNENVEEENEIQDESMEEEIGSDEEEQNDEDEIEHEDNVNYSQENISYSKENKTNDEEKENCKVNDADQEDPYSNEEEGLSQVVSSQQNESQDMASHEIDNQEIKNGAEADNNKDINEEMEQSVENESDDCNENKDETTDDNDDEIGSAIDDNENEPSFEIVDSDNEIPMKVPDSDDDDNNNESQNGQIDRESPEIIEHSSPEEILRANNNHHYSYTARRNTSLRATKSLINNTDVRPSLALHRESTGISDGTRSSSGDGSGWDSHRTTRRTIRQTLGRDITSRKSLRALVMERSAKRQTAAPNMHITDKLQGDDSTDIVQTSNFNLEDNQKNISDQDDPREMREARIKMQFNKHMEELRERLSKIDEAVKNSLKTRLTREPYDPFKVPQTPPFAKREKKVPKKNARKQCNYVVPDYALPKTFFSDLQYKPPKPFQPRNAGWTTKRLYKFLESKLKPKYDYRAHIRAERLVQDIYNFVTGLRKLNVAPPNQIEALKREMARLHIVRTHYEFYTFFREYMPMEFRIKVIPDTINKLPVPRDLFGDILRE